MKIKKRNISLIAVLTIDSGIGKENKLLTHVPNDLPRFKRITSQKTVIMGRKTLESIGRILPKRRNIVLTTKRNFDSMGAEVANSIKEALNLCSRDEEIFCIGGQEIYEQLLPYANKLYITRVFKQFDADRFFPEIDPVDWHIANHEQNTNRSEGDSFDSVFVTYERTNPDSDNS